MLGQQSFIEINTWASKVYLETLSKEKFDEIDCRY